MREETLAGGPSGSKTSRAASPTSSILSNETLPVKKRPLSAEQTGLNLSSTPKKKRSEVADEFVSSAILHSITLPAHDSAHWVIGVMPQDDKKKAKNTSSKAPKSGYTKILLVFVYTLSSSQSFLSQRGGGLYLTLCLCLYVSVLKRGMTRIANYSRV